MKRSIIISVMLCGAVLFGLMARSLMAVEILTKEDFITKTVATEQLVKTADNAIILFDASFATMKAKYRDTEMTRYDIARKILEETNEYLPDLGYNIGLYSYTPWNPLYPMQRYDREKFAEALKALPTEPVFGEKQLQKALLEIDPVLEGLSGRTIVFVFTDGRYVKAPGMEPVSLGEELARKYPVCFVVVSTADDRITEKILERFASVNACSRVVPFEAFIDRPEYITGALYEVKAATDVVTTTETRVVGAKVDNVLFDFDKSDISAEYHEPLNKLGTFLKDHPASYAVIAGYADNSGGLEYNYLLSRKRAESVAEYLRNNFDIAQDRLVTLFYGVINPIADNKTKEGRRMNRRAEIAVGGLE